MSSKNGKSENIHFKGRIKEIEQEIVEFQLNLARSQNQSESLQRIISALLLHGKLTQSQIKKLVILSKSTISTGLLNLLNLGHIKKEKIPGLREYAYYISSTYKESMNNALGSLVNEIKFLEKKLEELIENYSYGFDAYAEYVKAFPPSRVEAETGVPAETVERVARMIGQNAPNVINYVGNGLEHHENGINNIRAVACLDGL